MKDKVLNYIRKWNMLEPQDQVIVGISGGADSVCLLFVLLEIQKEIGYTLLAVHIHHGLRGPEADADEQYVKALCGDYGVQCLTYHYDVECIAKQRKQSTEEAGRILRREVFARVKEEY
ncbi:MAG: ATP-binding protein, partial [Lachnospiraceae bacterium]